MRRREREAVQLLPTALIQIDRAPGAPRRTAGDWLLLAVFTVAALAAWAQAAALPWRPATLAFALLGAVALFYRRNAPGAATVFCFGGLALFYALGRSRGTPWDGLDAFAFFLLLAYTLLRWGSGREIAIGVVAMLTTYLAAGGADADAPAESIAGATLLAFPALLGALFRAQDRARRKAIDALRQNERTDLARELHDSVAHHVAAIAVQAQGARAIAGRHPQSLDSAVGDALDAIEESAVRALEEMRRVVGVLREEPAGTDDAGRAQPRAPQSTPVHTPLHTLAELDGLTETGALGPAVRVHVRGDAATLDASLQHTLYSLAREGVTNARRHARDARHVIIAIDVTADPVALSVEDDGRAAAPSTPSTPSTPSGFGLRGLRERVQLLGGSFSAGPSSVGGWRIDAALPRGARA